ncbi:MAG TPA: ABC transporter substrate-binding protein [Candidatus Polarisedimenticolia bacterium]|nr:ABC transporter substrate-binding protein [Candidatus Polarisedimenticolia bacterium]
MVQIPGICPAPQYLVEELLRAEGWTDVQYVKVAASAEVSRALAAGAVDVSMHFAGSLVAQIDAGDPIVLLAGIHSGCLELFGTAGVRTVSDLKGKTIAVPDIGPTAGQYVFLSSLLTYIGLDPRTDVQWAVHSPAEGRRLLAEGKVDAYLGWPPEPQDLRAKKIGHVLVNTAVDRPWAQYFCCLLAAHREFVRTHPVATKHALRAFLKATDMCALEPDRVARFLVERGYTPSLEYAMTALRSDFPMRWREYDPEDTVRFYALRMHEAGMIKSSPQRILAQGTDWRFLDQLKKELKG